ncbi:hypothetical protein MHM39_05335 [Phaeobacter sp. CNT1-3]|nr:hypothetical protein [Phaeobacter sp. CNT1-3]
MSAAHRPEFDQLAAHIKSVLNGRPALFVINPGNWGDSLIREGAEAFLRHYGIPYVGVRFKDLIKKRLTLTEAKARTFHDDPVLIFNGNGAFCPHYQTLGRVAELSQEFKTSIILPSTYAVDVPAGTFAPDTHLFVRDRFQSQDRLPDVPFCHDMAFFLELSDEPATHNLGLLFREDGEAPEGFELPDGNIDVSKFGRAHTPIDGFVRHIAQYERIETNRLHVGIAAALLKREVQISSNDYFKIGAIFDSSIRDYFPNAQFVERA